jgi:hypothetical protein
MHEGQNNKSEQKVHATFIIIIITYEINITN